MRRSESLEGPMQHKDEIKCLGRSRKNRHKRLCATMNRPGGGREGEGKGRGRRGRDGVKRTQADLEPQEARRGRRRQRSRKKRTQSGGSADGAGPSRGRRGQRWGQLRKLPPATVSADAHPQHPRRHSPRRDCRQPGAPAHLKAIRSTSFQSLPDCWAGQVEPFSPL
ncbi:hypothetical protein VTK56DRAFT_917 [Thermocarpiscus australiensis]